MYRIISNQGGSLAHSDDYLVIGSIISRLLRVAEKSGVNKEVSYTVEWVKECTCGDDLEASIMEDCPIHEHPRKELARRAP